MVVVAVPADDEPREQVGGVGLGHAPVTAFAAFGEQCLGLVEEHRVDEGLVGLVTDVAEGDLAQVAAVA